MLVIQNLLVAAQNHRIRNSTVLVIYHQRSKLPLFEQFSVRFEKLVPSYIYKNSYGHKYTGMEHKETREVPILSLSQDLTLIRER